MSWIVLVLSGAMYLHSRRQPVDHNNVNDEWVEKVTDRKLPEPALSGGGANR